MHHVIASQKLECDQDLDGDPRVGPLVKTLSLSLGVHLIEIHAESLVNKVLNLPESEGLQLSYNVLLITRVF